jgi:hypothetical protein
MLVPLRAAFLRTRSITSWHWLNRTRRVAVVGTRRAPAAPVLRIGLDVGRHLAVLRDERRFVGLERRFQPQQFRLHAAGGDPVREHAQRTQQFRHRWRQGSAGRHPHRNAGLSISCSQPLTDADHPVAVAGSVEGLAQDGAQQAGVEHLGQQRVAETVKGFGDEAGIRQDAGYRVQLAVAIGLAPASLRAARKAWRSSGWCSGGSRGPADCAARSGIVRRRRGGFRLPAGRAVDGRSASGVAKRLRSCSIRVRFLRDGFCASTARPSAKRADIAVPADTRRLQSRNLSKLSCQASLATGTSR